MAEKAKTAKKRRFSFRAIGKFFKEVWAELKRVSWPSRKELWTYTGVVIAFVLAFALIIGLADLLFGAGMRWIVGT